MNISTNTSTAVFACSSQKRWCTDSFRDSYFPAIVCITVVSIILGLIAVIGNGLIFFVYYKNGSIRTPANTILLSLAITDFITGAFGFPLFIYEKILVLANCGKQLCNLGLLRAVSLIFLTGATLAFLSVTSLDRYIAVLHSLRYYDLVTNSRATKLLITVVAFWIGLFVVSDLSGIGIGIASLVFFLSNVVFIVVINLIILREIRRLEARSVVAANETEEARKAKERKSAKAVGIIVGLLICCFLPEIPMFIIAGNPNVSRELFDVLLWCYITLILSNSSLNFFVYFWKNTEIRSAILKVFRPVTQRFNNEVHASSA